MLPKLNFINIKLILTLRIEINIRKNTRLFFPWQLIPNTGSVANGIGRTVMSLAKIKSNTECLATSR